MVIFKFASFRFEPFFFLRCGWCIKVPSMIHACYDCRLCDWYLKIVWRIVKYHLCCKPPLNHAQIQNYNWISTATLKSMRQQWENVVERQNIEYSMEIYQPLKNHFQSTPWAAHAKHFQNVSSQSSQHHPEECIRPCQAPCSFQSLI